MASLLGSWLCIFKVEAQGALVLPQHLENEFGNGRRFLGGLQQQIYPSDLFNQVPSDAILITGIAFRHEEGFGVDANINLILGMATFAKNLTQVSRIASENVGEDHQIVYSIIDQRVVGSASAPPDSFELSFTFQTPFIYNKNRGHLLLTLDGTTPSGLDAIDYQQGNAGNIVYLRKPATFFEMDIFQDSGIITKLQYQAIPEPVFSFVLFIGLIFLVFIARQRK